MSEPLAGKRPPADRAGRLLLTIAKMFALAGGLVLVALTVMSLVSVVGRAAFAKPLPGDYELIQLGCAVAVSAFLPFCQMRGGHVLVDFFTVHSRPSVRATLDTFGALLLGIAAAVFAWRLTAGAISLKAANDQTTILEIPDVVCDRADGAVVRALLRNRFLHRVGALAKPHARGRER